MTDRTTAIFSATGPLLVWRAVSVPWKLRGKKVGCVCGAVRCGAVCIGTYRMGGNVPGVEGERWNDSDKVLRYR